MLITQLTITVGYALTLTCLFVVFTMRVFALRGNVLFRFLRFGNITEEVLARAVRGHGNFTEYTPIFLLLLLLAEMHGASSLLLHLCAALFTIGRILHGGLFCFMQRKSVVLRIGGMVATMTGIVGISLVLAQAVF